MSLASQFGLTRQEILDRFHQRIHAGDRVKLTRAELEALARLLVDRLVELQHGGEDTRDRIEALCQSEKALLEEGYPVGSVSAVYLPTYTRLVKAAINEGRLQLTEQNSYAKAWTKRDGSGSGVTQKHHALDFLVYDAQTQIALRNASTQKNNERQDDLQPVRLESYLEKVNELMSSEEPETLAVAIAALTGRRFAEVLSVGRFSPTQHPFLVQFEGQQKKEQAIGFEILGLVEAQVLLPLIERFRALSGVRDLVGRDDDDPEVQLFNGRVNARVRTHFQRTGLVPIVKHFKTVSVHRLRGVYGTIAIHFWCANNQNVHRFLQNHLGHVLMSEVGVSNSRATDHYFHYYLVREDGTPITARGVKLMANPALPEPREHPQTQAVEGAEPAVIEAPGASLLPKAITPAKKLRPQTIRTAPNTRDRWNHLLAQWFPNRLNQADRMGALLEWLEQHEPKEQQRQPEPEQGRVMAAIEPGPTSELAPLKETIAALLQRIERLEQQHTPVTEQPATPAPPPADQPSPTRKPTAPAAAGRGATERAAHLFLALQQWNRLHPDQTFALTLSLLKDEFGINFKAARSFLQDHQAQIEELHQRSGVVNPRSHNRQKGRNVEELKHFVRGFGHPG